MSIAFFEGKFVPTSECRLPITDLVIQRGVGVFDSIRLYDRRAFAISEHMKRLEDSARLSGIDCGGVVETLTDAVRKGALRDDCPDGGDCIAKPYITGGDINDHGRFPEPRAFVIFESGPPIQKEEYRSGIALQPTDEGRPYPLVKSINYLVGLMQTVGMNNVAECLYCPDGEITETLRSSFFICTEGKIVTAPVGRVLGGVTRNIILELARENGFNVEERCPLLSELSTADEAFITSSWKEVMPVTRVGEQRIGNGKPGPATAHLQKLFRSSMDRWLDK
jgi:branched-chain amino acid aminotransferase